MATKEPHQLVVTSLGIVTSVGHDAVTACASIRAGLTRAAEVSHWSTIDEDEQKEIPITGHPVTGITDGFTGVGRWLRLSELAFQDMIHFGGLPDVSDNAFWNATGLVLVLPHLDDFRFMDSPLCQLDQVPVTYQKRLLEAVGLRLLEKNTMILDQGHAGVLMTLANLPAFLSSRRLQRAIVLATDSLLDAPSLAWLAQFDRLKTEAKPMCLMPGEAGIAILVERSKAAQMREATPLALLHRSVVLEESDHRSHGRAMAKVISNCLRSLRLPNAFVGDLFIDLNGENWRAYEFGAAQSMVPRNLLGECNICIPALSVGDTGAASGCLSVALAARSLQRGYSKTQRSLVVSSGEQGRVAAMVLQRWERSDGR